MAEVRLRGVGEVPEVFDCGGAEGWGEEVGGGGGEEHEVAAGPGYEAVHGCGIFAWMLVVSLSLLCAGSVLLYAGIQDSLPRGLCTARPGLCPPKGHCSVVSPGRILCTSCRIQKYSTMDKGSQEQSRVIHIDMTIPIVDSIFSPRELHRTTRRRVLEQPFTQPILTTKDALRPLRPLHPASLLHPLPPRAPRAPPFPQAFLSLQSKAQLQRGHCILTPRHARPHPSRYSSERVTAPTAGVKDRGAAEGHRWEEEIAD